MALMLTPLCSPPFPQAHFKEAPITTLRDCLDFASDRQPIPIAEVMPGQRACIK